MNILVINAGSSSLKFQLFDGSNGDAIIGGNYVDIGETAGKGKCIRKTICRGSTEKVETAVSNHRSAVDDMIGLLHTRGFMESETDITAVGHRIVHGGERYGSAMLLTRDVMDYLSEISSLAPLHNPVGLSCVNAISDAIPGVRQFAVFDTAFHRTIPEKNYLYGLPLQLYKKFGIRKYGFHGINHACISHRASEILGRDIAFMNIITCHLGNGQSLCAVRHGKSFDTSMGFTPLEGLPMGTRSGSFDPEIIFFLMQHGYMPDDIKNIINNQSGLLGLSGIDSHYKIIEERACSGDASAKLTSDILINRIICLIGAYTAEMGGVDAIVFSGGIGENSEFLRKGVLNGFAYAGLIIDDAANRKNAETITTPDSAIAGLVIPANEELQIMREVKNSLNEMNS